MRLPDQLSALDETSLRHLVAMLVALTDACRQRADQLASIAKMRRETARVMAQLHELPDLVDYYLNRGSSLDQALRAVAAQESAPIETVLHWFLRRQEKAARAVSALQSHAAYRLCQEGRSDAQISAAMGLSSRQVRRMLSAARNSRLEGLPGRLPALQPASDQDDAGSQQQPQPPAIAAAAE